MDYYKTKQPGYSPYGLGGGGKPPKIPRWMSSSSNYGSGGFNYKKNRGLGKGLSATKNVFKATKGSQVAFGVARGLLGVGAIAAYGAQYGWEKGKARALGPGGTKFHSGKAGSHYLDLSANKPGKYGVDY